MRLEPANDNLPPLIRAALDALARWDVIDGGDARQGEGNPKP